MLVTEILGWLGQSDIPSQQPILVSDTNGDLFAARILRLQILGFQVLWDNPVGFLDSC